MASSAASSVLYVHNEVGNHAETSSGASFYYGDAASFHEWEFRTRLRIAGKTGDQYIEAVSKVCDGLRGDAFVAAQEVGLDNLCESLDGRPSSIDTLINLMRGMVFPQLNTSPKNYSDSTVVPEDFLSRQNGESMKQYVSRRRRCWTLLTQMDPVMHLSEGRRSDMLLDLSGLTREERVMGQSSINNERDFDKVADALIIQHPRIHLQESRKRAKGKGKHGIKSSDSFNTRRLQERGKYVYRQWTTGSKCLLRELHFLLKITVTTTIRSK